MRYGITYRNKHSTEFGVVTKTKGRTLLPDIKSTTYDLPLADGEFDFSAANEYKRVFYKPRTFEITLQIYADNMTDLQRKAVKVSHWLCGKGDLIFDDCAGVKWNAKVISNVTFTPEKRGKTAEMSVVFYADPIGKATFDTVEGIYLSDAVALESNIPFNMTDRFIYNLETGMNEITVYNIGDFYVRPQLIFDAGITTLNIVYEGKNISVSDIATSVVIDLDKCTVTDRTSLNIIAAMSGSFFELPSGATKMNINVDAPTRLVIKYNPCTIYDFDFSELEWGDSDA